MTNGMAYKMLWLYATFIMQHKTPYGIFYLEQYLKSVWFDVFFIAVA